MYLSVSMCLSLSTSVLFIAAMTNSLSFTMRSDVPSLKRAVPPDFVAARGAATQSEVGSRCLGASTVHPQPLHGLTWLDVIPKRYHKISRSSKEMAQRERGVGRSWAIYFCLGEGLQLQPRCW